MPVMYLKFFISVVLQAFSDDCFNGVSQIFSMIIGMLVIL